MTYAVTIHLASGQTIRSEINAGVTEEALLFKLKGDLSGPPTWRIVAGVLIYSQVVSAIEVEPIGGTRQ